MKHFIIFCLVVFSFQLTYAQKSTKNKLLGIVAEAELKKEPFEAWYQPTYESFEANAEIVKELKEKDWTDKSFQLFFGTWCGDSRREVPKMLKLLKEIGIEESQIELIAVNNTRKQYKQSPTHEEEGKNINRVPTLIMYKNGEEVNRFVEYARESLEGDLLKIVKEEQYIPQYSETQE